MTVKLKRIILSVIFGAAYCTSVIIGDALGAGSTFNEGLGHALFFGTGFCVMTLPALLLLSWLIARWLRRRRGMTIEAVSIWEFLPLILLSLLFLTALFDRTPDDYFRRFIADQKPASVSDIKYWYSRGYGNHTWFVQFRIAPEDFPQILTRYDYVETYEDEGFELYLLSAYSESREDFPIPLPRSPLVFRYKYSEPRSNGDFEVSLFTNSKHDVVYAFGGSG